MSEIERSLREPESVRSESYSAWHTFSCTRLFLGSTMILLLVRYTTPLTGFAEFESVTIETS